MCMRRAKPSAPMHASCTSPWPTRQPRVLVLVVGETARAANFSLLGYPRETNPELAKTRCHRLQRCHFLRHLDRGFGALHVLALRARELRRAAHPQLRGSARRAGACRLRGEMARQPVGLQGRVQGRGRRIREARAGHWRRICATTASATTKSWRAAWRPSWRQVDRNTVFVLHMMGNHGPAYFRRYPAEFRRFLPDCATAELRDCSRERSRERLRQCDPLHRPRARARDSHVVAGVHGSLDSAMIYVSDHGESLGERGLYLHGIPYAIAPELQTHVPMIVWVSRQVAASGDVDVRCLRRKSHAALSHDNLFHSVLGLLDVETRAYRPALDIFDGCRGGVARSLVQSPPEPVHGTLIWANAIGMAYGCRHGQAQPQHRARRRHRGACPGILTSLESALAGARHAAGAQRRAETHRRELRAACRRARSRSSTTRIASKRSGSTCSRVRASRSSMARNIPSAAGDFMGFPTPSVAHLHAQSGTA